MNPVTYKGEIYRSLAELCKKKKVSCDLIRNRIKMGESLEEALDNGNRYQMHGTSRNGNKVIVNGIIYDSLSAAARAYNLNVTTVDMRIKYGYTIEEAFGLKKRKKPDDKRKRKKETQFAFNGRTYKSIKEFCKINDLEHQYSSIVQRLSKGEEFVDIITNLKKREKPVVSFEIDGRVWTNYLEFCKYADCVEQYSTFLKDIQQGMSEEDAYKHILKIKNEKTEEV